MKACAHSHANANSVPDPKHTGGFESNLAVLASGVAEKGLKGSPDRVLSVHHHSWSRGNASCLTTFTMYVNSAGSRKRPFHTLLGTLIYELQVDGLIHIIQKPDNRKHLQCIKSKLQTILPLLEGSDTVVTSQVLNTAGR